MKNITPEVYYYCHTNNVFAVGQKTNLLNLWALYFVTYKNKEIERFKKKKNNFIGIVLFSLLEIYFKTMRIKHYSEFVLKRITLLLHYLLILSSVVIF